MNIRLIFLFILLLPIAACSDDDLDIQPLSVMKSLIADGRFIQFSAAVEAAGAVNTLETEDNITVFAPTDQAFTDAQALLSTLSDSETTTTILYHIVSNGSFASTDFTDGQILSTGLGTLTVNVDSTQISITDQTGGVSMVIEENNQASNGVYHVIDRILLRQ